MGETVEFASNGHSASGYLVRPPGGSGPGVVVVQEWWGLDPSIKKTTDQVAAAGFVALAPDLYHGEVASHTEMDKAGQLMSSLPPERAARDMSGAVDYLSGRSDVTGSGVGVIGFCMGGMLAFHLAAARGDRIKAAVPFYGLPPANNEPDWAGMTAAVRGHFAEKDDFFPASAATDLAEKLRGMGKDVSMTVHAGTGHAFMNPENALGTTNEELAARIWPEVFAFLHERLD